MWGLLVKFSLYSIAGAAGAVAHPVRVPGVGVSPLDHKPGDDPVEGRSVIEALPGQFHEIIDMVRGLFREKFQYDIAEIGMDDGLEVLHGRNLLRCKRFRFDIGGISIVPRGCPTTKNSTNAEHSTNNGIIFFISSFLSQNSFTYTEKVIPFHIFCV